MKQLHATQRKILKKLLFTPELPFSKLKPKKTMENNEFVFHLEQMMIAGYVAKSARLYSLTSKGKEYANRMDTDKNAILPQAKIGAIVVPFRGPKNKREFLIYTRLKHPFYGCQGFLSGKIRIGEQVTQTAQRELKEETNLEGKPEIVAIKHYRVFDRKTQELLEDKFMFFCKVENPKGSLIGNNEGKYEWVKRKYLAKYVTNHFESFAILLTDISLAENFDGNIKFLELDYYSEKF